MTFLTPERTTPLRPIGIDGETLGVRSYLLMRVVIGCLGIALPVILVVGDLLFLDGGISARGSLSAYYHSGMRDVFVGVLVVTGIFLITYKLFRRSLDNTLSIIAGVSAIGVAVFPTGLGSDVRSELTPLQDRLGEDLVKTVHFVCAAIFIVMLAWISYFFAVRESRRPQQRGLHTARFSPNFWRSFHLVAAGAIAMAIVFIVVTKVTGVFDEHSLLIGETIAAWAFGASWLAKGLELEVLRGAAVQSSAEGPPSPSDGGVVSASTL